MHSTDEARAMAAVAFCLGVGLLADFCLEFALLRLLVLAILPVLSGVEECCFSAQNASERWQWRVNRVPHSLAGVR